MFIKIATGITLMCTSFTGVAVVSAEPGDSLYPVKVEMREVFETTFNTNSEAKVTNNQDGFIKVYGDVTVDAQ